MLVIVETKYAWLLPSPRELKTKPKIIAKIDPDMDAAMIFLDKIPFTLPLFIFISIVT